MHIQSDPPQGSPETAGKKKKGKKKQVCRRQDTPSILINEIPVLTPYARKGREREAKKRRRKMKWRENYITVLLGSRITSRLHRVFICTSGREVVMAMHAQRKDGAGRGIISEGYPARSLGCFALPEWELYV